MDNPDTPENLLGPEVQEPGDSGKLILPPPVRQYSPVTGKTKTITRPLPRFSQPLRATREVAPQQPLAKIGYYWRKDPAYKVFMIAICLVLIAGVGFVSFATAAVMHNPNLFSTGTGTATATPAAPTSQGAVDFRPTFPTPGGQGSNQSSQPPVVSTPALPSTPQASPTSPPQPTPTQPQNGGTLAVQIVNIPSQVFNGQTVQVVVSTSIPYASVHINVSYNAPPYYFVSATQQTDGDGNAVLYWSVGVAFGRGHINARVIAVATSEGQRAFSQVFTVRVVNAGMG